MNRYKIRSILDFIRSQGRLPTDERGVILHQDDIVAWFGLNKLLTVQEQRLVKQELLAMIEAEAFMERLRLEQR
ncbi:MAG: hypothetical protein KAY37_12555 [Phycisphaerae bacterium]|nr:hypothetical protein [Phycisphaerae bacterium]